MHILLLQVCLFHCKLNIVKFAVTVFSKLDKIFNLAQTILQTFKND